MTRPMIPLGAVILAGGTAVRMGGADKAGIELHGRTLLEYALDAVAAADEVVVVGQLVPTPGRLVTFTREDPPLGGPAAGVLAGLDAFAGSPAQIVVLAVDMPRVISATVGRMREAAEGRDGAVLVDAKGRAALAYVLDTEALQLRRPPYEQVHGLPLHRLLDGLDLASVPALNDEDRDVDSWEDLRDLRL